MSYNDGATASWNSMSAEATLPSAESYAIPGMVSTSVEIPLFLVG